MSCGPIVNSARKTAGAPLRLRRALRIRSAAK